MGFYCVICKTTQYVPQVRLNPGSARDARIRAHLLEKGFALPPQSDKVVSLCREHAAEHVLKPPRDCNDVVATTMRQLNRMVSAPRAAAAANADLSATASQLVQFREYPELIKQEEAVIQAVRPQRRRRTLRCKDDDDDEPLSAANSDAQEDDELVPRKLRRRTKNADEDPDWDLKTGNSENSRSSSSRAANKQRLDTIMNSAKAGLPGRAQPQARGAGPAPRISQPLPHSLFSSPILYSTRGSAGNSASAVVPHSFLATSALDSKLPHPLEVTEDVRHASGGYRRFIAAMSDQNLMDVIQCVESSFKLTVVDDRSKLAQAWNMLPEDDRINWELLARNDCKRATLKANRKANEQEFLTWLTTNGPAKALANKSVQEGESGDDGVQWYSQDEYEEDEANIRLVTEIPIKKDIARGPAMPLSEFPLLKHANASSAVCRTGVYCPLCPEKNELRSFYGVLNHLISVHPSFQHYGCHFCGSLYQSRTALQSHRCAEYSNFMFQHLSTGTAKIDMSYAMVYLACTDCGIIVPLRASCDTQGQAYFQNSWALFMHYFSIHNCKGLMPFIVYLSDRPVMELDDFKLEICPSKCMTSFPLACDECHILSFTSITSAEEHFKKHHPSKKYFCTVCSEQFGIQPFFYSHLYLHLPTAVLFADYLQTQARLYPPPHDQSSSWKLGAKGKRAFGGLPLPIAAEVCEYVEPFQPNTYNKLMALKINKAGKSNGSSNDSDYDEDLSGAESEESSYSSPGPPQKRNRNTRHSLPNPLLGYRSIPCSSMRLSKQDQAIKTKLGHFFTKEARSFLLDPSTRLINGEEALKMFGLEKEGVLPRSANELKFESIGADVSVKKTMMSFMRSFAISVKKDIGHTDLTSLLSTPPDYEEGYFYCTVCNSLCAGYAGLKLHQNTHCAQGGIEPTLHNNKRRCKESSCSASGLRAHMLLTHGRLMQMFSIIKQSSGLLKLPPYSALTRTFFANKIDRSFHITRGDGLVDSLMRPANPTPSTRPMTQMRPVLRAVPSPATNAKSPTLASALGVSGSVRQKTSTATLLEETRDMKQAPFYVSNSGAKTFYHCVICMKKFDTFTGSQQHLTNHLSQCGFCGMLFSSEQTLATHRDTPQQCSRTFVQGSLIECPMCTFSGPLGSMAAHFVNRHFDDIKIIPRKGIVYPQIINFVNRATGQRTNISQLPPTAAIVLKRPSQPGVLYVRQNKAFPCFMCDMTFDTSQELRRHYELHPETWKNCLACSNRSGVLAIQGHEEMRLHIMDRHIVRKANTLFCTHCNLTIFKRPVQHVLYECAQIKCCLVCNANLPADVDIRSHRATKHGRQGDGAMCRFECAFCHVSSYSYLHLLDHRCPQPCMPHFCSCNKDLIFKDRQAFEAHFAMAHASIFINEDTGEKTPRCKLCNNKSFLNDFEFEKHRNLHLQVRIDQVRKTMLVAEYLVPKMAPKVGEEAKVAPTATANVKVTALDSLLSSQPGGAQQQPTALSRVAREEPSSSANVVTSCTYFEDNADEPEIETKECPTTKNVVEVVDENGDDEIAIIAEVTNASSTSNSDAAASARKKTVACSKCSDMFLTKHARDMHLRESHRYDAGGTIYEELGIPEDVLVHICRACCAAFETQRQLQEHMRSHNSGAYVSCAECSYIAYNSELSRMHSESHSAHRILFGCGKCCLTYQNDSDLYSHLNDRHHVKLLYFCKDCNIGSTEGVEIASHCLRGKCVRMTTITSPEQRMGVVPASLVHYNPRDVPYYKAQCGISAIKAVEPSMCAHRSFVAPTGVMVSCPQCDCFMNVSFFNANQEHLKKPLFSEFKDAAPPAATPQKRAFYMAKKKLLVPRPGPSGSTAPTPAAFALPKRQAVPGPQRQMNGAAAIGPLGRPRATPPTITGRVENAADTNLLTGQSTGQARAYHLPQPASHPRAVVVRNAQAIPSSSSSPTTTTLSSSSAAQKNPTHPQFQKPETSAAAATAAAPKFNSTRLLRSTAARASAMPSSTTTLANGVRVQQPISSPQLAPSSSMQADKKTAGRVRRTMSNRIGFPCVVCNMLIKGESSRQFHSMHDSPDMFFCFSCAQPCADEQAAVEHCYTNHFLTSGADGKYLRFELECPFSEECRGQTFDTIPAYTQHLSTHAFAFKSSGCAARFNSEANLREHEAEHKKMDELGLGAQQCCPLCGSLTLWTKKTGDVVLSHMCLHGIKSFYTCRDCHIKFTNDAGNKQMLNHYETKHLQRNKTSNFCKICDIALTEATWKQHALEKHRLRGFSHQADMPEFVVRTTAEMRSHLGLPSIASSSSSRAESAAAGRE